MCYSSRSQYQYGILNMDMVCIHGRIKALYIPLLYFDLVCEVTIKYGINSHPSHVAFEVIAHHLQNINGCYMHLICHPHYPCISIISCNVMSLTCCTATCYTHYMNLKSAIPTVPVSGLHQYMSCHLPAVRPHVIHIT